MKIRAYILIALSLLTFITSAPMLAQAQAAPCPTGQYPNNSGTCTTSDAPLGKCVLAEGALASKTTENVTEAQCNQQNSGMGGYGGDVGGTFYAYGPDGKATGQGSAVSRQTQADNGDCSFYHPIACLADLVLLVPGYAASYIVMPLMSLLVYLSGIILNWSMEYSVVHMSAHFQETNISAIWAVVRDLANMGFIFMILYTAIMTVLQKIDTARTIKNLVIAALLINFSMLITEAIVDASNVLAMLFYNAIAPGGTTTTTGLGAAFMQVLNLQSLYNLSGAAQGTKMAIVGVAGSAIYLIASFTFLAVAVMFIIRFVALVFVIALSPIYAIGKILPNAGDYAKQWEKALVNQAFFAPVYLGLTWLALKVAEGLIAGYGGEGKLNYSAAVLGQTQGNTVHGDPSAVGVFMIFAIIIGLLIAALTISKGMATKAHPMLAKAINTGVGYAGGASLGFVGGIGRNTLGRAGAMIGENEKLKDKAAAGSITARLALAASRKTSEKSFDFRGTSLGKGLGAGEINKNAKGGYKKVSEEAAKKEAERVKSYMMDKDHPDYIADQENRRKAAEAAAEALEAKKKEAAEAAKTAHPDAQKSQALLDAEADEIRTRESINLAINPTQKDEFTQRHEAAKARAEELRTQHEAEKTRVEEARKAYIEQQVKAAQEAKDAADKSAKEDINTDRTNAAVKDAREGSYRTGTKFIPNNKEGEDRMPGKMTFIKRMVHLSDNAKAAAIRKKMKEKSPEEKAAEALKELEAKRKKEVGEADTAEGEKSGDKKGDDKKENNP